MWIEEGCTGCGLCETICLEVFRIDTIAYVNEGVNFAEYSIKIKEAVEC